MITSVVLIPIVTTDTSEKAYITVTSKPVFESQPFNLDLYVDSNHQVPYTTTLVPPLASGSQQEGLYVLEFMVCYKNLIFKKFNHIILFTIRFQERILSILVQCWSILA